MGAQQNYLSLQKKIFYQCILSMHFFLEKVYLILMHKLSILSSIILRKILIKENFFCRLVERSKPLIIELLGIKQKKWLKSKKSSGVRVLCSILIMKSLLYKVFMILKFPTPKNSNILSDNYINSLKFDTLPTLL